VGLAGLLLCLALNTTDAATVYTPIYNTNVTANAPHISGSVFTSPLVDTDVALFPRAWGTLTGVTVEYLAATGSHEATASADGAAAGQSVIFKTRAFSALRSSTNATFASQNQTSPVSGHTAPIGGPPATFQANFALPDFNNTSDAVASFNWETNFYDDSAYQLFFRNNLHFTLSGNIGVTATGLSDVAFSQRIRYDFTETAVYINAGSPQTIPEPASVWLVTSLVGVGLLRRRA